ncbi:MAG TPA: peptidylprolyl isomerase [Tepidisphaeraceae bacterium]|nr:peptidylprolyl isomerase [Tepidisphaeraceae bacterium]
MHRYHIALASTAVFFFLFAGCGSSKHLPATLKPQAFQPMPNAAPTAAAPATQPTKNSTAIATDDPQTGGLTSISRPATRPAVGASSGTFMYIGAVVADVNGQPIYADKILAKIDTELSAKAPLLEPREFRLAAEAAIRRQIEYDISLEREFASAQRNATDEEQQRAKALAAMWRQREIIKAGGSVAVARRMSLDKDGIDFEEKVNEQYQSYMILINFQNRIMPLVQISGDDMRRFYDQNVAQLFTEKSGVRFRAIKVSVNQKGGREAALKGAELLLERAKRGEDFANMASDENDDPTRRANRGWWMMEKIKKEGDESVMEPTWIDHGALAGKLEEVEKAAFALEVGEVSPVPIDVGDGFYILKLEQKQKGRVRAFEEPEVQGEIRRRLGSDQRRALREKDMLRLSKESVVRQDPEMFKTTVNMAMQKYFAWSRANGLTRADPTPAEGGTSR